MALYLHSQIATQEKDTSIHRSLYTSVHSNTIYNSQKVEISQLSTDGQIHTSEVIHTGESLSQEQDEALTKTTV
jgi:hypothetical protein